MLAPGSRMSCTNPGKSRTHPNDSTIHPNHQKLLPFRLRWQNASGARSNVAISPAYPAAELSSWFPSTIRMEPFWVEPYRLGSTIWGSAASPTGGRSSPGGAPAETLSGARILNQWHDVGRGNAKPQSPTQGKGCNRRNCASSPVRPSVDFDQPTDRIQARAQQYQCRHVKLPTQRCCRRKDP